MGGFFYCANLDDASGDQPIDENCARQIKQDHRFGSFKRETHREDKPKTILAEPGASDRTHAVTIAVKRSECN
jgi:hypothetical protein